MFGCVAIEKNESATDTVQSVDTVYTTVHSKHVIMDIMSFSIKCQRLAYHLICRVNGTKSENSGHLAILVALVLSQ